MGQCPPSPGTDVVASSFHFFHREVIHISTSRTYYCHQSLPRQFYPSKANGRSERFGTNTGSSLNNKKLICTSTTTDIQIIFLHSFIDHYTLIMIQLSWKTKKFRRLRCHVVDIHNEYLRTKKV